MNTTAHTIYERYVGSITPVEFVTPFDFDIANAIDNLIANWVWEELPTKEIQDAIYNYVSQALDDA